METKKAENKKTKINTKKQASNKQTSNKIQPTKDIIEKPYKCQTAKIMVKF